MDCHSSAGVDVPHRPVERWVRPHAPHRLRQGRGPQEVRGGGQRRQGQAPGRPEGRQVDGPGDVNPVPGAGGVQRVQAEPVQPQGPNLDALVELQPPGPLQGPQPQPAGPGRGAWWQGSPVGSHGMHWLLRQVQELVCSPYDSLASPAEQSVHKLWIRSTCPDLREAVPLHWAPVLRGKILGGSARPWLCRLQEAVPGSLEEELTRSPWNEQSCQVPECLHAEPLQVLLKAHRLPPCPLLQLVRGQVHLCTECLEGLRCPCPPPACACLGSQGPVCQVRAHTGGEAGGHGRMPMGGGPP
mmetsp:Transcript_147351/g.257545  ORF Transcript_147351/g.257545 Transcript_147351/m.257545 type:complete len:299 (-) Transcript_147351:823-1719(-)